MEHKKHTSMLVEKPQYQAFLRRDKPDLVIIDQIINVSFSSQKLFLEPKKAEKRLEFFPGVQLCIGQLARRANSASVQLSTR